MASMICAHCGAERDRRSSEINRAVKNGRPLYCSRSCSHASRKVEHRVTGWHARRFEERDGTVNIQCQECDTQMWLPPSKVGKYHRCSTECSSRSRTNTVQERARNCATCGNAFVPRPRQLAMGGGRYCSQKCNTTIVTANRDPSFQAWAAEGYRRANAEGRIQRLRGPDSPHWKGGSEASKARRRDSGKQAAGVRAYRAKNPHKVREFASRRKGRKIGRLPYGTIPRIGKAQCWRCAICRADIRKKYDVDHIKPLALGGPHEPRNIQLLCHSCNVRKSARDPMVHMRSLGRLL